MALTKFQEERRLTEEEAKKFEDMFSAIEGLEVRNLDEDLAGIKMDESKEALNDEWLTNIRKDIYIDEVLSIMRDMSMQ